MLTPIIYRKKPAVEARLGMSLELYIEHADAKGMSQRDMALDLGVTQVTMGRWLRDAGYKKVSAYRRVEVC